MEKNDVFETQLEKLRAAVAASSVAWTGLAWESTLADLARALERADRAARQTDTHRAERLLNIARGDLERVSTCLPATHEHERHRARVGALISALADAGVGELEALSARATELAAEEAQYVAACASTAEERGQEALEHAERGGWLAARYCLVQACACERQFGDDPAWAPTLRLAEQLGERFALIEHAAEEGAEDVNGGAEQLNFDVPIGDLDARTFEAYTRLDEARTLDCVAECWAAYRDAFREAWDRQRANLEFQRHGG